MGHRAVIEQAEGVWCSSTASTSRRRGPCCGPFRRHNGKARDIAEVLRGRASADCTPAKTRPISADLNARAPVRRPGRGGGLLSAVHVRHLVASSRPIGPGWVRTGRLDDQAGGAGLVMQAWPTGRCWRLVLALGSCAADDESDEAKRGDGGEPMRDCVPGGPIGGARSTDDRTDMQIRISIGERGSTATLDDSAAAEDLLAQPPVTVAMEDHGGVEKTGPLPPRCPSTASPTPPTPMSATSAIMPRATTSSSTTATSPPSPASSSWVGSRATLRSRSPAGRRSHRDRRGGATRNGAAGLPRPRGQRRPDPGRLGAPPGSCTTPPRSSSGSRPSSTRATAHPRRRVP